MASKLDDVYPMKGKKTWTQPQRTWLRVILDASSTVRRAAQEGGLWVHHYQHASAGWLLPLLTIISCKLSAWATPGCTPTRDHEKSRQVCMRPNACLSACQEQDVWNGLGMPCEVIGHSQRHAEVPEVATDAGQAIFKCPESVPALASSSRGWQNSYCTSMPCGFSFSKKPAIPINMGSCIMHIDIGLVLPLEEATIEPLGLGTKAHCMNNSIRYCRVKLCYS
eukprot:6176892-Pleurochrysis_carterae.AAC.1